MSTFTKQSITYTGVNITFAAPEAFPSVNATQPSDRAFIWMKNTDASSKTITVVVPGETFGQANPDVSVSVPSGGERLIGPIDANLVDPSAGAVLWANIGNTGVTIAVVELPTPPPDLP